MSDPITAVDQTPRSVAILGADALLAALPATPMQLANACFAGGYDEVYPATWGDELIAAGCLEQLESRTGPAIFCACPLVAEQLRGTDELHRFIVPLISPPVAVARYLRSLHPAGTVRITYAGDCPGADDDSIDERFSPRELLRILSGRGILPAAQAADRATRIAHDRRRFYSLPGGVPSPEWLAAQVPRRTLVDVHAGDALAGLANQTRSRSNTLIDFAPHLGCACAGAINGTGAQGARDAVIALEPPRSQGDIVHAAAHIEVSLAPAGEQHVADLTWGDFLAALPAAFAAHPEHAGVPPTQRPSRASARRAMQKKAALPRAYVAARAGARRERSPGPRPRADILARPSTPSSPSSTPSTPSTPCVASSEGLIGPRTAPPPRAGLATADRWLVSALMLTSSVLVAVLTSALTVRGMQRSTAVPLVAVSAQPAVSVAATPPMNPVRDTTAVVRASPAEDTAVIAVAVPAEHTPKITAARAERHPASIRAHARTTPSTSPVPSASIATNTKASTPPALVAPSLTVPASTASSPIAPPPATPAAVASPVSNAQFLEELRAIHAEIDARKRHMDSLTAALDSLKHISKPN